MMNISEANMLTPAYIAGCFAMLERHALRVATLSVHPKTYPQLVASGKDVTDGKSYWGAEIVTDNQIAEDEIHILPETRYRPKGYHFNWRTAIIVQSYVPDKNENQSLAEVTNRVFDSLTARGLTMATAESLTGGMVASAIVQFAGASKVYRGGAIVYTDAEKTRSCDVPEVMLKEHTAVSEPVAIQMARGIREKTGADVAVATTGYAGPDQHHFYIGIATKQHCHAVLFEPKPKSRQAMREYATLMAYIALSEAIQTVPPVVQTELPDVPAT